MLFIYFGKEFTKFKMKYFTQLEMFIIEKIDNYVIGSKMQIIDNLFEERTLFFKAHLY